MINTDPIIVNIDLYIFLCYNINNRNGGITLFKKVLAAALCCISLVSFSGCNNKDDWQTATPDGEIQSVLRDDAIIITKDNFENVVGLMRTNPLDYEGRQISITGYCDYVNQQYMIYQTSDAEGSVDGKMFLRYVIDESKVDNENDYITKYCNIIGTFVVKDIKGEAATRYFYLDVQDIVIDASFYADKENT